MTGSSDNRKGATRSGATPRLVLDFAPDAIRLLTPNDDGALTEIGAAPLDDPDFAKKIAALRVEATVRGGSGRVAALRLPPDQLVKRRIALFGPRASRHREASERLAKEIGHPVGDVLVSVSEPAADGTSQVIGALRQTASEAAAYATRWGFEPGPVISSIGVEDNGGTVPVLEAPGPIRTSVRRSARRAVALVAGVAAVAATGFASVTYGPMLLDAATPDVVRPGIAGLTDPADGGGLLLDLERGHTLHPVRLRSPRGTLIADVPSAPGQPGIDAPGEVAAVTTQAVPIAPVAPPGSTQMTIGPAPTNVAMARPGRLAPVEIALARANGLRGPQGPALEAQELDPGATPIAIIAAATGVTATDADYGPPVVLADSEDLTPTEYAPQDMPSAPLVRPDRPSVEAAAPEEPPAQPSPSLAAVALTRQTPTPATDPDAPTEHAALEAPPPPDRPQRLAARYLAEREARRAPPSGTRGPRALRLAAEQSGLALDRTSLLGVIQGRSGRQALVRMPSGDFRKVSRGDELDGWRVASISRTAVRLTRRGQNKTLLLVNR